MKKRICSVCKIEKRIVEFVKNKCQPLGHSYQCVDCTRKLSKPNHDKERFGNNRELVILRDGEKCVICGMTRAEHKKIFGRDITVDHIDWNGRYSKKQNNKPRNLRTLCLKCHGKENNRGNFKGGVK